MSWEGELVDQVIKQKIERVEIKTHDSVTDEKESNKRLEVCKDTWAPNLPYKAKINNALGHLMFQSGFQVLPVRLNTKVNILYSLDYTGGQYFNTEYWFNLLGM